MHRVMYMSLHRGNGFYPNTGAATDVGTGDGLPQPILISWPLMDNFLRIASEWKCVAELPSRKEMKAQFLSCKSLTDSI